MLSADGRVRSTPNLPLFVLQQRQQVLAQLIFTLADGWVRSTGTWTGKANP